jgi:hypothetical protein
MMAASLHCSRANDSSPSVSLEAYRQHIRGTTVAANDFVHRQEPDTACTCSPQVGNGRSIKAAIASDDCKFPRSALSSVWDRNRPKDQSRHVCLLRPLSLHDGQDHGIGYCAPVVEIFGEEDFYATSRLTIQRDGSSTVHEGTIGRLQLISPAGRWQIR